MDAKVKGGWTMDRDLFTENARKVFEIAVDHRRAGLVLTGDAEKGERYRDNAAILARLESMFIEGEFMEGPGTKIDAALTDAAQSDYWYHHEKKYDYPEIHEDEEEIADGEDDE